MRGESLHHIHSIRERAEQRKVSAKERERECKKIKSAWRESFKLFLLLHCLVINNEIDSCSQTYCLVQSGSGHCSHFWALSNVEAGQERLDFNVSPVSQVSPIEREREREEHEKQLLMSCLLFTETWPAATRLWSVPISHWPRTSFTPPSRAGSVARGMHRVVDGDVGRAIPPIKRRRKLRILWELSGLRLSLRTPPLIVKYPKQHKNEEETTATRRGNFGPQLNNSCRKNKSTSYTNN